MEFNNSTQATLLSCEISFCTFHIDCYALVRGTCTIRTTKFSQVIHTTHTNSSTSKDMTSNAWSKVQSNFVTLRSLRTLVPTPPRPALVNSVHFRREPVEFAYNQF